MEEMPEVECVELLLLLSKQQKKRSEKPKKKKRKKHKKHKAPPPKRGKLPTKATKVLKDWLFEHVKNPYPSESEKRELMAFTNLSLTQINNWFSNSRRRTLASYKFKRRHAGRWKEPEREEKKVGKKRPRSATVYDDDDEEEGEMSGVVSDEEEEVFEEEEEQMSQQLPVPPSLAVPPMIQ